MDIQLNIKEAQHQTLINFDINSAENIEYIVKLLQSLNFIRNVEIITPLQKDVLPTKSRFARYYGAAKTGLCTEELDKKINDLRNE
jgi:hypothetical protein